MRTCGTIARYLYDAEIRGDASTIHVPDNMRRRKQLNEQAKETETPLLENDGGRP
jgi:hypothetical protein